MTEADESNSGGASVSILFAALNHLREAVSIAISRSDGQIAVHVGIASDDSAAWAQRILAPDVLLDDDPGPRAPVSHPQFAVRFRPAPSPDRETGETGQPALLDRLTAVEAGSWTVQLDCRPVEEMELQHAIVELTELSRLVSSAARTTRTVDEVTQAQLNDPAADSVLQWLELHITDLGQMGATGGWTSQIWVQADTLATAQLLTAAVVARAPQDAGQPSRVWLSDVRPVADSAGAAVMSGVMSSGQLAAWLAPPKSSRGGLSVGAPLPSSRMSLPMRRELRLGTWLGTPDVAGLDIDDLSGHAFVTGVTGSGKSTTLLRLLMPLWNVHGIPFLVIDPVKDDYSQVAGAFSGGLRMVRGAQLRLNALRPWPGTSPGVHLDQVGAAFKGCFSMPSPIPYVVSLLLDELRPRMERGELLTLHDVRKGVRPVVAALGYRGELEGNILASLETRLAILTAPHRAERFCAEADDLAELFDHPTVVTLSDLGDDEERAFVMALLTVFVSQQARARGPKASVCHVTVIEEAHRMVGEPSTSTYSAEHGDAAGYAARMVAQLLAEIRSTGESVILLDQSPAAVAREVVRNTNTKILHRILDPADRELVAGTVGLDASQAAFLTDLGPGQAVISHSRLPRPQLIRIAPPPPVRQLDEPEGVGQRPVSRACCGTDSTRHHRAQQASDDAEQILGAAATACLIRPPVDRPSIVYLARHQLDQLAVRADLPDAECLRVIGAQAVAQNWQQAGWISGNDAPQQIDVLIALFEGRTGEGHIGLPKVPFAKVRPFDGCSDCQHSCTVRPIARRRPELSRIRNARPRGSEDAAKLFGSIRSQLAAELQPLLGAAAAADTARCVVLHAVGDVPGSPPGAP